MRSLLLAFALCAALFFAPRADACGSGNPTATADLLLGPALMLTAADLAFTVYSLPFIPRSRAVSMAQVAVTAPQAILYLALAVRSDRGYEVTGSQGVLLGLAAFNTLLAAGGIWSLTRDDDRRMVIAPLPGGAAVAGRF